MNGKALELDNAEVKSTGILRGNSALASAMDAWSISQNVKNWWVKQNTFSVVIKQDDPIYQDVHDWLLQVIPTDSQKSLVAASGLERPGSARYTSAEDDEEEPQPRLILSYNDSSSQAIMIEEHRLKVAVFKPDRISIHQNEMIIAPESITFLARNRAGQQAVIRQLEKILASRSKSKRKPVLWLLNSWGSWARRSDLPPRSMDSVVLREGQLERLRDDLDGFLKAEGEYARRGIPWHRGYLLHGPPGTGKTSVARALANHFGLDLWYAPLGDLTKDSSLISLLGQVHARSVLLLEDVDVFDASRERNAEKGELSLSGLLNALDGVATPHGLVTIMTTNDRSTLDDALIRPGRVDLVEDVGLPDDEQTNRLFVYFYGEPPRQPLRVASQGMSVSDITEVFKRHMYSPRDAEQALRRMRAA